MGWNSGNCPRKYSMSSQLCQCDSLLLWASWARRELRRGHNGRSYQPLHRQPAPVELVNGGLRFEAMNGARVGLMAIRLSACRCGVRSKPKARCGHLHAAQATAAANPYCLVLCKISKALTTSPFSSRLCSRRSRIIWRRFFSSRRSYSRSRLVLNRVMMVS